MGTDISRRDFLGGVLTGGLAAWMGGCSTVNFASSGKGGAGDRPNLVLVMTDDLCWNMMGFHDRYPFLQTPNFDRLKREGAYCRNAFSPNALCMPARASVMTGMHAYKHGVKTNMGDKGEGDQLGPDTPTFPQLLQQAGYETALVGKRHIDKHESSPKPGFDQWVSFQGQGEFFDPELNINGEMVQESGHISDVLTRYATEWISRDRDKPFCLILAHKLPHGDTTYGPYTPPERHQGELDDVTIAPPPNYHDDLSDKPEWVRRYVKTEQLTPDRQAMARDMDLVPKDEVPERVPPEPWDSHPGPLVGMLSCVSTLDECLGTLLETLRTEGVLDDTFLMYTSDHGHAFYNHQIVNKRVMYEEGIRVPMLIRYPRIIQPGTELDEMALTLDIAPTMLELAGAEVPGEIQGRSLVPVLQGDKSNWREAFVGEYYWMPFHPHFPTVRMARSKRWKYLRSEVDDGPDEEELYDLEDDPHELTNLAVYPGWEEQLKRMRRVLQELGEG